METRLSVRRNAISVLVGFVAAAMPLPAQTGIENVPVIAKRVEKVFLAPGKMPNALQATADGLWILDQQDPNKAHKVRFTDGSVLVEIQTESIHGSGITFGGGALWIASTFGLKTLKVDPTNGKTLASFDCPGLVNVDWGSKRRSGAHGLEWVDGKYWMAVPPTASISLIEPDTGKVVRSIPAPGVRPHGLAWENGFLWCVESNHRAIYKLDPKDGRPLAKIQLSPQDPEPHGLTASNGVIWYCDAASRWVCRLVDP